MPTDNRADNLRTWRARRGYSQDRLAALADMSKPTIQNLEAGRTKGYKSTWRRLAEVLDVDVDVLLSGFPPEPNSHRAVG